MCNYPLPESKHPFNCFFKSRLQSSAALHMHVTVLYLGVLCVSFYQFFTQFFLKKERTPPTHSLMLIPPTCVNCAISAAQGVTFPEFWSAFIHDRTCTCILTWHCVIVFVIRLHSTSSSIKKTLFSVCNKQLASQRSILDRTNWRLWQWFKQALNPHISRLNLYSFGNLGVNLWR